MAGKNTMEWKKNEIYLAVYALIRTFATNKQKTLK
jgi:hypothetical protein